MIRRLLVGQRQNAPGLQRGQGRSQAGGTVHAVEHDLTRQAGDLGGRLRTDHEPGQPGLALRPPPPLHLGIQRELDVLRGGGLRHRHHVHLVLQRLRCQQLRPAPPAANATTRNRSRLREMTSSAWVPIDPVEPRRTTSRLTAVTTTCILSGAVRAASPHTTDSVSAARLDARIGRQGLLAATLPALEEQ
jgi:hypothetical protein